MSAVNELVMLKVPYSLHRIIPPSLSPAVDPGLISLSLAYSISLAGMFQYGVRMGTEVEGLVSVYWQWLARVYDDVHKNIPASPKCTAHS